MRIISIHAPREGGDNDNAFDIRLANISIHAPREGGDSKADSLCWFIKDFNPRPP